MIKAVLMMTTLGAGLGLLLAIAGKVLYVEVDNRVETIIGMLPGLNCGACGFPGCQGLAEGLVSGEASSPSQCKPSTEVQRKRISVFMETGSDPQV